VTAQSAKTLQDLVEAASTLFENLNERDQRSDRVTHIQLWIAVGSVVVAAVLSGAAFFQDKANNTTNDKWQGGGCPRSTKAIASAVPPRKKTKN
jgi:ADP-ribosylglycohydrolase